MFRFAIATAVTLACAATSATAEVVNFCWKGANGYTMTGKMDIADRHMSNAVITENHLKSFKISGYRNGGLLGTWDMRQRAKDTTFHVRFDPISMAFMTGGSFPATNSQGWNANGDVEDCGSPGFGFNSGNYAQDICVNGTWVEASSIAPETQLIATTGPVTPACNVTPMTSKSPLPTHSD